MVAARFGHKACTGEDCANCTLVGETFVVGMGAVVWRWAAAMLALLVGLVCAVEMVYAVDADDRHYF